jgi:hypothetical protein
MFGRKKKDNAETPDGLEPFDRQKMRNMVFETLGKRVGEANAAVMKSDFMGHIAEDPKDGVEVAYLCLLGKMVDMVDRINDILESQSGHVHGDDQGISPFLTFRKDG